VTGSATTVRAEPTLSREQRLSRLEAALPVAASLQSAVGEVARWELSAAGNEHSAALSEFHTQSAIARLPENHPDIRALEQRHASVSQGLHRHAELSRRIAVPHREEAQRLTADLAPRLRELGMSAELRTLRSNRALVTAPSNARTVVDGLQREIEAERERQSRPTR
jgi:hypothetical protein